MTNEEVAVKIANHDNRIKVCENRLKDIEEFNKKQNDLIISVNKLADNMERMAIEQVEQGKRLKKLENEPAERWNTMQRSAFTTIVGVIAGALALGIVQMIATNI